MKVANLIARFLRDQGIRHVFLISGGGNLHLIKAIHDTEGIEYVCPQTETAAGYAADGYARIQGIGACLATSGPGATNLITAVSTSFYDSIPCLYITGNVTRARMSPANTVRQTGFQETPITEIVKPITKWAITLMQPDAVPVALERAVHIAKSGRPGPVLLDFPDDIQRAEIVSIC
jgi:acetolactate synthase I/II/III large subunit